MMNSKLGGSCWEDRILLCLVTSLVRSPKCQLLKVDLHVEFEGAKNLYVVPALNCGCVGHWRFLNGAGDLDSC